VINRETYYFTKDKKVVHVEVSSVFLSNNKGEQIGAVCIARDITERKRAEKKLFEYQNKLKSLASQLTLTEERERRRFADYLHDHIGQRLFISKLKVEALKKSLYSTDNDKALDEIHEIIHQMIKDTRSLTSDLSPQVLYQLGLEAALECLTEQTSEQYGIMIDFEDDEQEKELEDDLKILLFQAVRELLMNVLKHARAQNAKVSVQRDNTHIKICVEDDGVGFNPSDRDVSKTANVGFGLFSIGERLDYLGGHFEIKSQPTYGTKATLMAPLKGKKEIQMG
jgi:signal transduction histidine kinase